MLRRVTIKDFYNGILMVCCLVCISISAISCDSDTAKNTMDGDTQELTGCTPPPPDSIYMCRDRQEEIDDIIAVDIILSSSVPVMGAAFDVVYDPAMVEVARKTDISIDFSPPEQSSWKYLSVVSQDGQDGILVVGASSGRDMTPLSGDLPVVTLKFKSLSGKSHLQFANNNVIDSTGQPIETFKDRWFGVYLAP